MAVNKTSLSVGELIREILLEDPDVAARCNGTIFPVATDSANLPCILYRRAGLSQLAQKSMRPTDNTAMEILCYTADYEEGIELAEAVRAALDQKSAISNDGTLTMSLCTLESSEESWQDDAYIQQMIFNIQI